MTSVAPEDRSDPRVRPVRRGDLSTVHRIERATFAQPWPYSAFDRYVEEPGFLVAERSSPGGPTVVGYVVADTVPNHGTPLGHVKDLAVAEQHRGEGVGSQLLERALAVLADQGVGSVKLEVRATNERAISLYRSYGFAHRRTVPGYYGNGEDALVMVRPLEE